MLRLTVVLAISAALLPAQHLNTMNPVRPMPAPRNALPYGNILFPGGIHHTQRVGGLITGSIPYTGVAPRGMWSQPRVPQRNRTLVVPYAVPVYGGGFYGYADYGYAPQPSPNVIVVPQQPAPSVIINQHYTPQEPAKPVLRDYSNVDLPATSIKVYEGPKTPLETTAAPEAKATIYLIALKDTSVRQAIGYWVEQDTLHYVTPKGSVNRVTLDMVDKEMTVQLNGERKLEFDWNAARRSDEPQP